MRNNYNKNRDHAKINNPTHFNLVFPLKLYLQIQPGELSKSLYSEVTDYWLP